jgi:hypothetical protein
MTPNTDAGIPTHPMPDGELHLEKYFRNCIGRRPNGSSPGICK